MSNWGRFLLDKNVQLGTDPNGHPTNFYKNLEKIVYLDLSVSVHLTNFDKYSTIFEFCMERQGKM